MNKVIYHSLANLSSLPLPGYIDSVIVLIHPKNPQIVGILCFLCNLS